MTRNNRQTIQYISPTDAHLLNTADLLIIDEAAAIPLPLVKGMLGPYLVFMASTINGYEGTGRSLSLKLISQLQRENNAPEPVKFNTIYYLYIFTRRKPCAFYKDKATRIHKVCFK